MTIDSTLYNAPFDIILEAIEERLKKAYKEAVDKGLGVKPWIKEALELTQRAADIYDAEKVAWERKNP